MAEKGLGPEFPISGYDRASISLTNLIRGNPKGMVQALMDPEGLGPDEMDNIRTRFLRGAGQNAFTKTIVDLATNPLMLIGLAMELHPVWGKKASASQLAALFKRGDRYVKDVNPIMKYLGDFITEFRALAPYGLFEEYGKFTKSYSTYADTYSTLGREAVEEFAAKAGKPMTKRQQYMVGLKLEEWDVIPDKVATRAVGDKLQESWIGNPVQGYYHKHFGLDKALLPNLGKQMDAESPYLQDVAVKLQSMYAKMRKELFESGMPQEVVDEIVHEHMTKGLEFGFDRAYLPHVLTRIPLESYSAAGQAHTVKQYERQIAQVVRSAKSGHMKTRKGGSLPYQHELDEIRDLFDEDTWNKLTKIEEARVGTAMQQLEDLIYGNKKGLTEEGLDGFMQSFDPDKYNKLVGQGTKDETIKVMYHELAKIAAIPNRQLAKEMLASLARVIGAPVRYSIEAIPVTQHYINATAPTYAWLVKGHGTAMTNIVNEYTKSFTGKTGVPQRLLHLQNTWNTTVAPMMRGFKSPKEYARSIAFQDLAYRSIDWLTNPDNILTKLIPESSKKYLIRQLSGARGSLSDKTIGGQIASLFYSSTLGLNMSPIMNNATQNLMTTMNVTGPLSLARGLGYVSSQIPKLVSLGKKIGWDKAMKEVFPEYYDAFGREGILEAMAAGDNALEGQNITQSFKGLGGKLMKAVGAPFGASEKMNRLTAFYAFKDFAIKDGMAADAAVDLAQMMTRQTQFTGGVAGTPHMLRGVWPPLKQFMHYPMRYLNFLYSSMQWGANPNQPYLGTIGRTLMTSAAGYELSKNLLGMDTSNAWMFGSLPKPGYEQGPFYPFPFVPPAISMAGNAVKSVASGDYTAMKDSLWLGVPAGLAIRRAVKTFSPKYADYKNRTPDGRIPMYNDKGMLIGSATSLELIGKGIGLRPDRMQGEQDAMKYLLRHRDDIREYRRQYLEALSANDVQKAEDIQMVYQKKYPGAGRIAVRKSDIAGIEKRREVSRLTRTLNTLPKDVRPVFQRMIEQAQLSDMAQTIDTQGPGTTLLEYMNH